MRKKKRAWGMKPWMFNAWRTASDSGRKLASVKKAINELENSNFIVKFFNKKSLMVLKEQKLYIERQIKKEVDMATEIHLLKWAHGPVDNIVKENKSLTRNINRSRDVAFSSKKEEYKYKKPNEVKDSLSAIVNITKVPKHKWRPKWKPRWPRKAK